jgi:serine/threonine protein kinase
VHRDLKLENILINHISENNRYDVRIADLGLACQLPLAAYENLTRKCGTPSYIAPEMLKNMGYREKCDIFSIGSILFNLFTGAYLFAGQNP